MAQITFEKSLLNQKLWEAAIDYTRRGLRVIALTGKAPNVHIHRRGLYDAFMKGTAEGTMHTAFSHPETTGIGILTGDPYYVVDIDGEAGAKAWQEIYGDLPEAWVASTGRGLHLWYAHSMLFCECGKTWRTSKLSEKLDFKGDGGYVAAPPSLHPNGNTYTWLLSPDDGPPHEMPEALHKILFRSQVTEVAAFDQTRRSFDNRKHKMLEDGKLWATVSFTGIIDQMKNQGEGNRNGLLYWCARTILEEGGEQSDLNDLADAAAEAGLSGYEIRTTMNSAKRGDRGN